MTSSEDHRPSRWQIALLAVYWVALFASTHWPRPPRIIATVTNADKAAHFLGYAMLAFLFALAWFRRKPFTWSGAAVIMLILAAYGAIDEWTQPWFGRHCSPFDWCADMLGVCLGLAVFRAARLATPANPGEAQ